MAATILAPIVSGSGTGNTTVPATKSPAKAKKTRSKSPSKAETAAKPKKAVTPRVIPVEAEQVYVRSNPKPEVSEEAQRIMKLALSGNQNVSDMSFVIVKACRLGCC